MNTPPADFLWWVLMTKCGNVVTQSLPLTPPSTPFAALVLFPSYFPSFLTLCFPVALLPSFPPPSILAPLAGLLLAIAWRAPPHPVHPSPPWSPPPGCWAPSRSCAPTSLPFLWSLSLLLLTLKVCALSSSIPKVISMSHKYATWPQCEMWELYVCRSVC